MESEIRTAPDPDRGERFRRAVVGIVQFESRDRNGIGMQKEKSLHAVLKDYMDPDPRHQEIRVGRYIADICHEEQREIIEIQTANMGAMRSKLSSFLPEYRVTILYPIAHRKKITWIDPESGELLSSRISPVTGSFYEIFRELYRIRPFLTDPNLIIEPVLLDMTEYRLQDGRGQGGRKGSHRFDRIPEAIYDELVLKSPQDYAVFLPPEGTGTAAPLSGIFTAKDLETAVGIHRRSISWSTVLLLLTQLGVVERVGQTAHNAWQYRILVPNRTGRNLCRDTRRK